MPSQASSWRKVSALVGGILVGLLMTTPLGLLVAVTGSSGLQELLVAAALVLWGVPLLYASGRLVGRRAVSDMPVYSGMVGVAVAGVLAILASLAMTGMIAGPALFNQLQEALRETGSYYTYLSLSALYMSLLVLLPSLFGYVRGRRQSAGAYMNYVLNKVSLDARATIASIAHQEALKSSSSE